MSIKHILTALFSITGGFVLGYQGMTYVKGGIENNSSSRTIASSTIHKMGADQILKDYLDIQLRTESVAAKNNETSVIVVDIKALHDVPAGLQYKWQLHQDMHTTDELSAQLPALNKNETHQVKISVTGFSKEFKSHINFVVMGSIGQHNVRRSLIVSSRPEDSLEYIVQQAGQAEEQQKSNGSKNQKVKSLNLKKKFDPAKVIK